MKRLFSAASSLALLVALGPAAADSSARRYRGQETLANPHHKIAVSNARGRYLTRRAVNHRFLVARGTEKYTCTPLSFGRSRCHFAFASDTTNHDLCGRAIVRATSRRLVVRYRATNRGCS